MPESRLSSRERMLAALNNREPDRVPLCFMIFAALRDSCRDMYEYVEKQVEMGLDTKVEVPIAPLGVLNDYMDAPGLPVRYDAEVRIREWREEMAEERYPLLHKEYDTPSGTLQTVVRQSDDWPHGDHVPFLDDYLVPRSRKFLIERKDEIGALRHLLTPVARDDVRAFRAEMRAARVQAERLDLLVEGSRGYGMELAPFLCGVEGMLICAMEDEGFVLEMADLIHEWNRERMDIMLSEGLDLFVRSGWYESTDFWSPTLFRKFMFPYVAREAEMAHQAGARFGYIMTSGQMPLLDMLIEAGVDVLIGVDPVQGKGMDMAALKQKANGRLCLWGGVNGFVTMEQEGPTEVRQAVEEAVRALGSGGGFILSPVDNVRDTTEKTWQNVRAMVEAWERFREYPID